MLLSAVHTNIHQRQKETLQLIKTINEMTYKPGNVQLCAMLKSMIVMILYNAIESTIYNLLVILHEIYQNKQFHELTDKQKNIFITVHFKNINIDNTLKNINALISNNLKFPKFDDYKSKVNLFSGNLDSRKINDILNKYGIKYTIETKCRKSFLTAKNLRNKLAHGENSFTEACRNMLISDIEKIHNDIINTLYKITAAVNKYLSQEAVSNFV